MRIAYLHGFNSSSKPDSDKAKLLSELGDVFQVSYNSCEHPDTIYDDLYAQLKEIDPDVVMGSSLGGYWAARLGYTFNVLSVLLNPSIEPHETLLDVVGENVNFVTGEKGILQKESVLAYDSILNYKHSMLVLLDREDEVLDSETTYTALNDVCNVVMFEGGSHRFEHLKESLDQIQKSYNNSLFAI